MTQWSISYPSGTIYKDGVVQADLSEYVQFLQGGGTPAPLQDAPPRRRIVVTAWQLVQELIAQDLYDRVDMAVAASGNKTVQAGWSRAPFFFSDEAMTLQIGATLGKTEDQMYALFESAERR
jgi:hypothetical protein